MPRSRLLAWLAPWFVAPVLASPLAALLMAQGAGAALGLDRAAFNAVALAMLTGYFRLWSAATLTGFAALGLARWRGVPVA